MSSGPRIHVEIDDGAGRLVIMTRRLSPPGARELSVTPQGDRRAAQLVELLTCLVDDAADVLDDLNSHSP